MAIYYYVLSECVCAFICELQVESRYVIILMQYDRNQFQQDHGTTKKSQPVNIIDIARRARNASAPSQPNVWES